MKNLRHGQYLLLCCSGDLQRPSDRFGKA
jgi:hypothetical protein